MGLFYIIWVGSIDAKVLLAYLTGYSRWRVQQSQDKTNVAPCLHPGDEPGHITVHNSETFQQFGKQQLSQPGSKSKLCSQTCIDMNPEEVKERKEKVGKVITLLG